MHAMHVHCRDGLLSLTEKERALDSTGGSRKNKMKSNATNALWRSSQQAPFDDCFYSLGENEMGTNHALLPTTTTKVQETAKSRRREREGGGGGEEEEEEGGTQCLNKKQRTPLFNIENYTDG